MFSLPHSSVKQQENIEKYRIFRHLWRLIYEGLPTNYQGTNVQSAFEEEIPNYRFSNFRLLRMINEPNFTKSRLGAQLIPLLRSILSDDKIWRQTIVLKKATTVNLNTIRHLFSKISRAVDEASTKLN